jgi:hypothetical protein
MRLKKHLDNDFEYLSKKAIKQLSGLSSLKIRNLLKENWDIFLDVCKDKHLEIEQIIFDNFGMSIADVSRSVPNTHIINIQENLKTAFNNIIKLTEHKQLATKAILWIALSCNKITKFNSYLDSQD